MTDDPDLDLVLDAYEAFARGDIDAAVADLHPEVEWIEPAEFHNGGHHHGPAAVAEYLRQSHAGWRELRSMPLARRHGDRIVVEHHVEGVLVDGTATQNTVVDVFLVRGGKVVSMHAYADPAEFPG